MALPYKKILHFIGKCIIAAVFCIGLHFFCREQTGGFQVHRICSQLTFHPEWEVTPLCPEEQIVVDKTLCQPFYYLGKGGSCYAFVSEDQKCVIKFFKHHHLRSWLDFFPLPSFLSSYRSQIASEKKQDLQETFNSFKIAYEHLKEETGLLYLHLNKTDHLQKKITLVDKIGIKHVLEADVMEFALQKKADLALPCLAKHIQDNESAIVKACIDAYLQLVISKAKKGVEDKDPALEKNFGFLGTSCIEIDLGAFCIDEKAKDPIFWKKQLVKEAQELKNWLTGNDPSLVPYVEEKVRLMQEDEK
jgi:hypothetical protein